MTPELTSLITALTALIGVGFVYLWMLVIREFTAWTLDIIQALTLRAMQKRYLTQLPKE